MPPPKTVAAARRPAQKPAAARTAKAAKVEASTAPKGAQSIYRAMDVFVAVGEHDAEGIRLTDVAQTTGLHVATAHRLLNALAWYGMVTYDSYSKRYSLGMRFHAMTDTVRFGKVRSRFVDALQRIAAATGDLAYLYLPIGPDVICIERIDASYKIKATIRDKGSRLPMGIGSAGVAMLALLPAEQANAIITANAARYLEYGLDAQQVGAAVVAARKAGYGLNRDQVMKGITGLGTALLDADGAPEAAIVVVGPSTRFDKSRIAVVAALVRAEAALAVPRKADVASAPTQTTRPLTSITM